MDIYNGIIESGVYQNLDAAGRQRVSETINLGAYKILNGINDTRMMETIGSATFTVNTNSLTISATTAGYGIYQSKIYHPYVNGKSQLIQITLADFGVAAGYEKEFGYISSSAVAPYNTALDGFRMFKNTSDIYSLQVWNNGSLIKEIVQADWYDKLDGNGASGMLIDFDKFNVFTFDFLWLGGTTLRCFVHYKGENHLVVEYNISNTLSGPFIQSPNKPIRYSIRNVTGSGTEKITAICSVVSTEGQLNTLGNNTSVKGNVAGVTLPTAGVKYAIAGVRKASTQRDIHAIVDGWEGIISTNDFIEWEIMLNPTLAGTAPTWTAIAGTPLESFQGVANNVVTGGFSLGNTYSSLNMNNARAIENQLAKLGSTLNNTMDQIILCATPTLGSANVKVTGSMMVRYYQ